MIPVDVAGSEERRGFVQRVLAGEVVSTTYLPIWIATLVLFAVSPLLAGDSLSKGSILALLPFAGALMIASVGQAVVVMTGGFDLSVPGVIAVTAAIVTKLPAGDESALLVAVLLAFAVALAAGLINGVFVSIIGVAPIVATLATNALLVGCVLSITKGFATNAPENLVGFATSTVLGVPILFVAGVVVVIGVAAIVRFTVIGRRWIAVGASVPAARAAGIPAWKYLLGSYVASAICAAVAGVLLAGFLRSPAANVGDFYLLTTVAAVILGGTALTGGKGSMVATAVGALFVIELNQLVVTLGAGTGVQFAVQGAIIAAGVGVRSVPWAKVALRRRRRVLSGA